MDGERGDFDGQGSLGAIPVELLLEIFSYISPATLQRSVRLVCRRFNDILTDYNHWKSLFLKKKRPQALCPVYNALGLYGDILKTSGDVTWQDVAVHYSLERLKWVDNFEDATRRVLGDPHFAPVDAVKLLNRGQLAVSGGRDRVLALWNTDLSLQSGSPLLDVDNRAHTGWIWDIDSCEDNQFYTCGWDSRVKLWSVTNTKIVDVWSMTVENPVMAMACSPGFVALGLHVARVVLFDPRVATTRAVHSYKVHRHAITDVTIADNYVVSISEDKTIACYDKRVGRLIVPPQPVTSDTSFPRCMSQHKNLLYVGDTQGNLHIYNMDRLLEKIQTIPMYDRWQVTCVHAGLGYVITGSKDHKITSMIPLSPHEKFKEFIVGGEVTSIDYANDILAVASTANTVQMFHMSSKEKPFV